MKILIRTFGKVDGFTKVVTKYEGPKKYPGAPVLVSFFTAGSWEKDTENGATGIFFGPSYFETALVYNALSLEINFKDKLYIIRLKKISLIDIFFFEI